MSSSLSLSFVTFTFICSAFAHWVGKEDTGPPQFHFHLSLSLPFATFTCSACANWVGREGTDPPHFHFNLPLSLLSVQHSVHTF